nr:NlpC/P60 family protein [Loigolactobacillus coryniformis]
MAAHRFDCSSFVHWAYAQAGVTLGNYTGATTWTLENYGRAVKWSNIKRGDIFMMDNVGHVGIYLGGGYFIHDSPNSSTGGVGINKLTDTVHDEYGTWPWLSIVDNINRRII